MKSFWIGIVLNPFTSVLRQKRRHRNTEEKEAEIEVVLLQAKEC